MLRHPFHAKDVRPFLHQQFAEPFVELLLVEIAGNGDADGIDFLVVLVLMRVRFEEMRIDLQDAVEVEAA